MDVKDTADTDRNTLCWTEIANDTFAVVTAGIVSAKLVVLLLMSVDLPLHGDLP